MNTHLFILYAFIIAVICGLLSLAISFRAASYVGKQTGVKIDYWDVRFHALKYLNQYREATVKETGRRGGLFSAWMVTMSLFVISMISVIILFFVFGL
jgi:hypothetical protein